MSAMAVLDMLAVAVTSSWRVELPADTALAVAIVTAFVLRISCSGVAPILGTSGVSWSLKKKQTNKQLQDNKHCKYGMYYVQ